MCKNADGTNCTSDVCYVRRYVVSTGVRLTRGCLDRSNESVDTFCNRYDPDDKVRCCWVDYCNADESMDPILDPALPLTATPETTEFENYDSSPPAGKHSEMLLILLLVIIILSFAAFLLIVLCSYARKKHLFCLKAVNAPLMRTSSVDFEPASVEMTSGSGSGLPKLTQQTVSQAITIKGVLGSGRFGQVYLGEYQRELVAVKKFVTRDELSWDRESEIYNSNSVSLRHDNILVFLASDITSNEGVIELWLITQYHPKGSLFDYLTRETLPLETAIKMATSISKGLAHLHSTIVGVSSKPPIAHRDIKSRNILVKDNLECCIADFGLAVIKGQASEVKFHVHAKQGTKRYMAPEILDGSIDIGNFESFLCADVYALGLVLWEIFSRCQLEECKPMHIITYSEWSNLIGQLPCNNNIPCLFSSCAVYIQCWLADSGPSLKL